MIFSSPWFLLVAGIALGMLLERWHMIRVVEQHRRMKETRAEALLLLAQAHGWMKTAGTPKPVMDRVESAAIKIANMEGE